MFSTLLRWNQYSQRRIYFKLNKCETHLFNFFSTSSNRKKTSIESNSVRSNNGEDEKNSISAYMQNTLGVQQEFHEEILDALKSAYGSKIKISHLKSFGIGGIRALESSIKEQRERTEKLKSIQNDGISSEMLAQKRNVHFQIPHHRTEFTLNWGYQESILDITKSKEGIDLLGEYMEGTCSGRMSCCTCHIYLDQKTYNLLQPPDEAELDMLDLAHDPKENSRLGCQVKLNNDLLNNMDDDHSIIVTIPSGVNNVWK